MAEHTPGPWFFYIQNDHNKPDPNDCAVIDDGGNIVAEIPWTGDDAETLANMRVIATAPDLLAALKWLLSGVEVLNDIDQKILKKEIDAARVAIAKATPTE